MLCPHGLVFYWRVLITDFPWFSPLTIPPQKKKKKEKKSKDF